MAGGGSFLVALLRRGAPAIATATSELPDEIADPAPMHALRRISRMSGPIDPTANRGFSGVEYFSHARRAICAAALFNSCVRCAA